MRFFPLVNADAHLNKILIGYAENALVNRMPHAAYIRSRVETAIASLLPHGKARFSEVAQQLGMSTQNADVHTVKMMLEFVWRITGDDRKGMN